MTLAPFTTETAAIAARKATKQRRVKAAATHTANVNTWDLGREVERADIGPAFLTAAVVLVEACVSGQIPEPETPLDRLRLAETARILHGIARLELGESTANIAHKQLTTEETKARLAELGARMRELEYHGESKSPPAGDRTPATESGITDSQHDA